MAARFYDFAYPGEINRTIINIKKVMEDNGIPVTDIPTNFIQLQTFLKDTGSVIAGGAILSWFHGDTLNDIDIYVKIKHIQEARTTLSRLFGFLPVHDYRNPSVYCKTHMKKNGIQKIYTLNSAYNNIKMDIMSIRNKKNILDIVQNFDFTFCQVWYDGIELYATHPEHVRDKEGTIRGEYNKEFIENFKYIRDRWRKYLQKHYVIHLDNKEVKKYIPTITYHRLCEADLDPEHYDNWFGHTMMKSVFGHEYHAQNTTYRADDVLTIIDPTQPSDDGYDSEEYTKLEDFFAIKPENVVFNAYMQLKNDYMEGHIEFTYERYNLRNNGFLKHYQAIVERSKKKGTCILTKKEDVDVYYLHQHDIDTDTDKEYSYVSPEGLQKYLEANEKEPRMKYYREVECFFSGCNKPITSDQVIFIVDDAWYKLFYEEEYRKLLRGIEPGR